MKAVILAGGLGTRLSEETVLKPKPLVDVGEMPIIWHIMKYYSHFGVKDFIICLGYKGYQIKNFFLNHSQLSGDINVNFRDGNIKHLNMLNNDWISFNNICICRKQFNRFTVAKRWFYLRTG